MQVLKIYLIAKQFYFTYGRSGDHRCSRHRGYSLQVDCPPHRNDSFGVQVVKEMGQKEQQIVRKTQTDKKKMKITADGASEVINDILNVVNSEAFCDLD